MPGVSATLSASVLKKAIDRYYKQLQDYKGRFSLPQKEQMVRSFRQIASKKGRSFSFSSSPPQKH